MPFLEYDPINRLVVQIHRISPMNMGSGNAIGESEIFQPGDEFTNSIYVNEVLDGIVSSYSVVRTNPQAARLLQENVQLQEDNASLWYEKLMLGVKTEASEREIAALWYAILMGGDI